MLLNINSLIRKKTVIVGELGSERSRLLSELVTQCVTEKLIDDLTVLDFSPTIIASNNLELGGKISNYINIPYALRYISPDKVEIPCLKARSLNEYVSIAKRNSELIDDALNQYLKKPTSIVMINEVSLYFPFGEFNKILNLINKAQTAIMTGYYGFLLSDDFNSGLAMKERTYMEILISKADVVLYLPPPIHLFEVLVENLL